MTRYVRVFLCSFLILPWYGKAGKDSGIEKRAQDAFAAIESDVVQSFKRSMVRRQIRPLRDEIERLEHDIESAQKEEAEEKLEIPQKPSERKQFWVNRKVALLQREKKITLLREKIAELEALDVAFAHQEIV